jgi:hypothetical protein
MEQNCGWPKNEFVGSLASTSGRSREPPWFEAFCLPSLYSLTISLRGLPGAARDGSGIEPNAANISDRSPRKTLPALLRKSVTTGDICRSSMLAFCLALLIVMRKLPIRFLTDLEHHAIDPPWRKTAECQVHRSVDRSHRKSPIMDPISAPGLNPRTGIGGYLLNT